MTTSARRRTGTALAIAAAMALAGPATAHSAEVSTDPALVAGGFLTGQLEAGEGHLSTEFDGTEYPSYGLTIDAILGLDAAGVGQEQAAASTEWLAANVSAYIGSGGETYSGSVAKTLLLATTQGVDPHAFGGVDLVATLTSLKQANGRFTDVSEYGDYSNTIGQSLAVIGLERTGDLDPASADFLAAQQCDDGGFRLDPDEDGCSSDPDVTAIAAQALIAAGGHDTAVDAGLDYLAGIQADNGAVPGGAPQDVLNTNSTGLAGQAFLAGGRLDEAAAAVDYITSLQYGCAFPEALRGGIAYNQAAYDAQVAAGADAVPADQDRRATAQAILALAGTPLFEVTAAGAAATAPAVDCPSTSPTTPSPTVEPTDATSEPTSGEPTGSTDQPLGPVVETDIPAQGSENAPALAGTALGLLALLGASGVWFVRRREINS